MTAGTNQAIDKLVAKGVRNLWYPICPSHFLGAKPISLRAASRSAVGFSLSPRPSFTARRI